MNIFILKTMRYLDNPELFTVAEMKKNASDADAAAANAAAAAAYAAVAAYYADAGAADADAYAAYDDAAAAAVRTKRWLDKYFKVTGEDKQDYINEVERLK